MPTPNTQLDYLRRIAQGSRRVLIDHTPVLDTSAYSIGDNLFATVGVLSGATAGSDTCELSSLVITSGIVTPVALLVFIFDRPVTLAAANAVFTLTDADMKFCQGCIPILTTDWQTADAGNAVATKANLDIHFRPNAGSLLYYAVEINTIATYGASDLTFKFGFQN